MADSTTNKSASRWKFPFRIKIENRVDNPPRWLSPVLVNCCSDHRLVDRRPGDLDRRRRSLGSLFTHRQIFAWQCWCSIRYDGESNTSYAGWPGLFNRLPDEIVEYRC